MFEISLLGIVFLIAVFSLGVAAYFLWYVLKQDAGTKEMRSISDAIREGANAFIRRQYKTVFIMVVIVAIIIFAVYGYTGKWEYASKTAISFLLGATCSAIAGIFGMWVSVRANVRTASAAQRSLKDAMKVSVRGGAVSGIFVVALSLLGVAGIYYAFGADPHSTPFLIVGFGFGASFVALFAQLGGGIYTKAADVGADIVGKLESKIPEDDPRNPAVIADLVGDNVGDCAGRGADLFESTAAENIGAMILGVALYPFFGLAGVLFPLIARAFGLIASIIGIFFIRLKHENEDPMAAFNRGYFITSIFTAGFFYIATMWLLNNIWYFYAGLVGILLSIALVYTTQYYTARKYRPVQEIVESSKTGAGTNIITGFSIGLESTALPVLLISLALYLSYLFGVRSGIPNGGLFGTAIATMGMLSSAAYILTMDMFGPITDNAGGIVEMSKSPAVVRKRTDTLDAVGNTTKAITKGYAIGSAALAAVLLFSAYLGEVAHLSGTPLIAVDLSKVHVFIGALLGAMLIFFFSAFAIRAVGKTAECIINDARDQLKNKLILSGKVKPDYARSVDITTKGALKAMLLPGLVVMLFPVLIGIALKAEAMAAFLMVGTICGILLALVFNNAGGAWDNSKKYIEMSGNKHSAQHDAAVVGDTVGDPFKDTAGPSLHVVIKLLSTITLVLAPLFI